MADEARLNDLLDLVEQARAEGDKDTEAKAVAAYKRESAPAVASPKKSYRMEDALPGAGGKLYNPDGTEWAQPAVAQKPAAPWTDAIKNVAQGAAQTVTGFTGGLAGDMAGLGAQAYDITANAVMHPLSGATPGAYADPSKVRDYVANLGTYRADNPDSVTNKVLGAPGYAFGGSSQQLQKLGDSTGLPYVGAILGGAPVALANYMGVRGSVRAPEAAMGLPKAEPAAVPTTPQLSKAANDTYAAADAAGVVIKPESTSRVVAMMQDVAKRENLGKLPTKLKEASDVLTERIAKNEPLSLRDADKVRQLIGDAMKSTDAADRRLAKIVQREYDGYIKGLKPEDTLAGDMPGGVALLEQARNLYQRKKNSEMVDSMEGKAATKAETNYSQAGIEHALRREFEKLSNNEKKSRYLTANQKAAVKNVAAPGAKANALRAFGKFDPAKGGMGATLGGTVGGGLGAALGGLLGDWTGAGVGSLVGSAAVGTAANLANRASAKITRGNVASAREALVGRGLPESPNVGLLPKEAAAQPASQSTGLLANTGAQSTRTAEVVQGDIRRLGDRVRFELAGEDASSPKVRQALDELQSLQRELAAIQANQ